MNTLIVQNHYPTRLNHGADSYLVSHLPDNLLPQSFLTYFSQNIPFLDFLYHSPSPAPTPPLIRQSGDIQREQGEDKVLSK